MDDKIAAHRQSQYEIKEVNTRFLYPFLYQPGSADKAAASLASLTYKNHRIWEHAKPHEFYHQDFLENVSSFLFAETGFGCRFLKVPDRFINSWFRKSLRMEDSKGRIVAGSVSCLDIEVFLSPYGTGILSIALKPLVDDDQHLDEFFAKRFNYRGSQLRRGTMPTFRIPHPFDEEGKKEKITEDLPAPPAANAPLEERLGALGGAFNLRELCDFLLWRLKKLEPWGEVQEQFSVYTVVRLGHEVSFDSEGGGEKLGSFLSGLSQVEEPLHAGSPTGDIGVINQVLNSKHWAAVSFLGAAHLIADQGSQPDGKPVPFNAQRMQTVREKYFLPYLTAYFQRLAINRMIRDAQGLAKSLHESNHNKEFSEKDAAERLGKLRLEMMELIVCSNFTEMSSREALNRFYDLARRGLRITDSLGVAKGAIADFDAANEARHQHEINEKLGKNIETVAAVQTKLEWLEVFFVSAYAAELARVVAEVAHFNEYYMALSVPLWAVLAATIAMLTLRPWEHTVHAPNRRLRLMFALLFLLAAIWVGIGFRNQEPHGKAKANTSVREK